MIDIVETITSLDTEPAEISRTITAFDTQDLVVLDVISQQATDPTIGTYRVNLAIGFDQVRASRVAQRTGRASRDAFATGNAGTLAHWIAEIEYYFGMMTTLGETNDIVDLGFAAGTHAARALDTGIEVDRYSRVRQVSFWLLPWFEARRCYAEVISP